MKTTHTHRGHCQACGRVHAVDTANNLLAKHGYTVEYGYFDGVCNGSDRKPLEVDKSFAEATIVKINKWIDDQKVLLQEATEGKKTFSHYSLDYLAVRIVPFDHSHISNKRYKCIEYTEENLRKHIQQCRQKSSTWRTFPTFVEVFARLQKLFIQKIEAGIDNAIQHIESLQKLIEEVHGKELINVADTEKLLKDLEAEAKIGFDETQIHQYTDGSTTKLFAHFEKEATKRTSIGLVGIKVSRPSVRVYRYDNKVSVNCLLNGKRIARGKLIQKLQGDI